MFSRTLFEAHPTKNEIGETIGENDLKIVRQKYLFGR